MNFKFIDGIKLKEIEKAYILSALDVFSHNRYRAAKALGISVRTIRNKIRLYQKQGDYKIKKRGNKILYL